MLLNRQEPCSYGVRGRGIIAEIQYRKDTKFSTAEDMECGSLKSYERETPSLYCTHVQLYPIKSQKRTHAGAGELSENQTRAVVVHTPK